MLRHITKVLALAMLASGGAQAQVVISQVYGGGGNSGSTYTNDFIELFNAGTTPQDLTGWTVQYASGSGSSWSATPLNGVIQPGQYYLVQEAAGSGGTTPLPSPDAIGSLPMGGSSGKVLLASDATEPDGTLCPSGGSVVDYVGYGSASCPNPTGTLSAVNAAIRKGGGCTDTGNDTNDFDIAPAAPRNTATPAAPCAGGGTPVASMADISAPEGDSGTTAFTFTVSLSSAAGTGGVSFDYATADGSAVAGTDYVAASGSGSIAEGDSSTTIVVDVNANTAPQGNRAFTLNLTDISGATPASLSATATIVDDDIGTYAIHEIQGNGFSSPLSGLRAHTTGNIVTAVGPAGFFMQTPDANVDASALTSEGIYVYTGAAPTVVVGDAVDLDATVDEFFGLTELKSVSGLVITSSGNPLPAAVAFDALTPSPDPDDLSCVDSNFECFEGMLANIANGIVARANPSFNSDPYAQIFVSASGTRSLRGGGTLYPLLPGGDNPDAGAFSGNPHIFELDLDVLGALPAGTAMTGGTTFSATGVISYNFGDYEFWPTSFNVITPNPMPRAVHAAQGGEELSIGSFNMLRLCDTLANTTYTCGDNGEPDSAELALKVARLSDYVRNVLNQPDVLGVVEVENLDVLQQLATRITNDGGVTYTPYLEEGNDGGGIDVGYLVRSDRVSDVVITQFDKDEMWLDPRDGQMRTLHDRPSLKLEASFAGQAFAIIVIHPKSRSCVDAPSGSNCTQADVDRNRLKRFTQAHSIALRVQAEQVAQPNRPLLVIGDYNDYPESDGFVHITGLIAGTYDDAANVIDLDAPNPVSPPLWNAVQSVPENERYSFLFTQQFGAIFGYTAASSFDTGRDVPIMQVLDQALLNGPARALFSGFEYGRADLDVADEDMENSTTAIGVSDHDGFVVRLVFDRIFADGFETTP